MRVPRVPKFDVGTALAKVPGGGALLMAPRTARWATRSMVPWGDRSPAGRPRPVPNSRLTFNVALDELVLSAMGGTQGLPTREDLARAAVDIAEAARLYEERGWIAEPRTYHRDPPPLTDADVTIARTRWLRTRYEELTFASGF